jgi:uncharacterized protein
MKFTLMALPGNYSICKFQTDSILPDWIYQSDFYSIIKTTDELSVVTYQNETASEDIPCSKDWRILKVIGPLDFTLVGVIADLSVILKDNDISIFTVSTYDTDYIMVKEKDLRRSIEALIENNYNIKESDTKH